MITLKNRTCAEGELSRSLVCESVWCGLGESSKPGGERSSGSSSGTSRVKVFSRDWHAFDHSDNQLRITGPVRRNLQAPRTPAPNSAYCSNSSKLSSGCPSAAACMRASLSLPNRSSMRPNNCFCSAADYHCLRCAAERKRHVHAAQQYKWRCCRGEGSVQTQQAPAA
jgi:hypothetical protein